MKKLLVLNPNSTVVMTEAVVAEVQALAGTRAEVRGFTLTSGPPVIASADTYSAAEDALLRSWPIPEAAWADGVLLACFGDPGLAALRVRAGVLVEGMATAALDAAAARGRPFHIVTAGAAWDGMLRALIAPHAAAPLLHGITVLPTDGLAVSRAADRFVPALQQVLDGLAAQGAPDCILGGAGFAGLRARLAYSGSLTDGVEAATSALLAD